MDVFGIAFVAGIVLLVLFGPWLMLWRERLSRLRDRAADEQRWAELTSRIHDLERKVQARKAVEPVAPMADKSVPVQAVRPAVEQNPAMEAARSWISKRQFAPAAAPPAVPIQPSETQPSEARSTAATMPESSTSVNPPAFATRATEPSLTDGLKNSLDIEEMLGTNWLNKLGIVILVLGVAFFLAYQLKTLGPAGKVLVGFVTAGAMLGAGIWFDRKDSYRVLARAGIGGGWALAFFTAYAMYHVPAAQVLSSQPFDLVLMLAVASAMVGHTLRYGSQVVTGLAFLLAFLTVAISHSNVYSLSAGAVLAGALVVIVLRMQWFELEVFGILGSYFNHYLWLRPIIEPMHGKRHRFPEFVASAGILVLYWAIYRVSYVLRRPPENNQRQERISSAAALLNTALLLALFNYQSVHPEWAFWALIAIGAIETLLGQLPITRRRRSAVIVLSTLGIVLLIAAFPFRYSGTRLSVLWLVEAEALLLIGVWTKEIIFRRLGMLGALLASGQMIAVDAAQILGRRMDNADLRPDFPLAIVFLVAAAIFYGNTHWIQRRYAEMFRQEFDRCLVQRLSYVGATMLLIAAWIAFPQTWTAVAWCTAGLALALAAQRLSLSDRETLAEPRSALRYQANFLAFIAVLRVFTINFENTDRYHGLSLRLLTTAFVCALLYVTSKWSGDAERGRGIHFGQYVFSHLQFANSAYTFAGSFLLGLLAWFELRPISVADAWMIAGLVLLEAGLDTKKFSLRFQAYAVLAAAFLRIFFVNLNAGRDPGEVSPRFYTLVPLALGFFYAYWRLNAPTAELNATERKLKAGDFCCWLGMITFAALMRFEMEGDWVACAWAALAVVLLAIAWRSGRRVFLSQALFIATGVLFRTVLHNFYERSYFPSSGWQSRWVTAGSACAVLLIGLPFTFQLRRKNEPSTRTGFWFLLQFLARRPEQVFFFVPIGLLTALLAIEMRYGMVTLSWGVEGVAVFVLALLLGERSFRLAGLGLLLLCVGRILLIDVWRLGPRDRYLTFIVLGAALLLVSFLYTKNREALRQYL